MTPSTINVGLDPTPFQVTVTTTGRSSAPWMPLPQGLLWVFGVLLLAAPLTLRKRVRRFAVAGLLVGITALALSCGGSGGGSTNVGPPKVNPTTPGTYSLSINVTTSGVQSSYSLLLTVN